jgi:hypothetical protein
MPFLHFETSEGYDRMFEVISEIKREKEKVKPKVKVNEEKKEKEKEMWKKTRQMKDKPSKKEAEKEQAAGKEREESLTREGKSSLEDGGKGEGPGGDVGNEGLGDLLSTGEKVEARQEAFHSATNTQDELSMHMWPMLEAPGTWAISSWASWASSTSTRWKMCTRTDRMVGRRPKL